jgi:L-lysine 2,3-aminomutase
MAGEAIDAEDMEQTVHSEPYRLDQPRNDPIFRQFLPLKSVMLPDHPRLGLDFLAEAADSPVPGLVHRYLDKALFLREFSSLPC